MPKVNSFPYISNRVWQKWIIPCLLFIVAFIPRSVYPVLRPLLWYTRSIIFINAIGEKQWEATYLQYHPGVTTMWLSGIGLKLFAWKEDFSLNHLQNLSQLPDDLSNNALTAGVLPLAFVISLCIVLIYFVLKDITNFKLAVTASFFIALDPFHISHSKVLHVDAILSILMILSTLYIIAHTQTTKIHYLILSGVFAGLSFLTKSSSLYLIPYVALLFGVIFITQIHNEPSFFWKEIRSTFFRLLLWVSVAVFIFIILWPRMWITPLETITLIWDNAIVKVGEVHKNPIFFNGAVIKEDPGFLYYLLVIAFKTTALTFIMGVISLLQASANIKWKRLKYQKVYWWIVIYVLFFFIQMGLSAKKSDRYILPIFLALNIMAAFGFVQLLQLFKQSKWASLQRLPIGVIIAITLLFQMVSVYQNHPYYGTHHNQLLGGTEQAAHYLTIQGQGEGLDLAGQFLNDLPESEHIKLSTQGFGDTTKIIERNFIGQVIVGIPASEADYRLYTINQVMRGLTNEDWEELLATDFQKEPFWTVEFDGVTYVWIYGNEPIVAP